MPPSSFLAVITFQKFFVLLCFCLLLLLSLPFLMLADSFPWVCCLSVFLRMSSACLAPIEYSGNQGEMLEIFHTSFLLLFHTRFGSIQSDGSNASSAELPLADVNWFDPSVRTIENTQSASPLCLPNNYDWNALAGRTTKTGDQRSSLRVVEEGLEQLRRVKGKLQSATILILRMLSNSQISLTKMQFIQRSC